MICPWAGGAVRYRPGWKGPLPVWGIVLFWGAAIPGDIPHIGTVGQWWVPSPRHYARNAWKRPSESASGPAPKPMSRACPSVRSRPPRASAPVGTQLPGSDEAREIPGGNCQQRGPNRSDEPRQEAAPSQGLPDLQTRLAGEMDALRRCCEWLERLDRGGLVVVDLRPETDPETVPSRSTAPPQCCGCWPGSSPTWTTWPDTRRSPTGSKPKLRTPRPPPPATAIRSPTPLPPQRLSAREERAALWAALGLPPHERRGPASGGNRDETFPVSGWSRKRSRYCWRIPISSRQAGVWAS